MLPSSASPYQVPSPSSASPYQVPSPSSASPYQKTLSLSTATVRNQRTLVWLQQQSPSVSWGKWNTVVTSLEDYQRWVSVCGALTALVVVDDQEANLVGQDKWLSEIYRVSKNIPFLALPQAILQWKPEDYWKENFDNLLSLDNLHEQYPFLSPVWNGTAADAIHMLALLCRYHRLVDTTVTSVRPLYDLVLEEGTCPVELVLYTQFYQSSSNARTQELRECLRKNAKCKWIDRIVLLNERDDSIAWASLIPKDKAKIQQRVIGTRLCYSDFLRAVQQDYQQKGNDGIAVLANADIYFGEETAELWRVSLTDRALCLLRWDDVNGTKKAKLFGPRSDSQDVWVFSSASVGSCRWNWDQVSIPLGKPGCDNAILYALLQHRFLLSNPALSIKTYHLHNSGVRSYQKTEIIKSPVYIHLDPTYLIDTKQETVPHDSPQHICNETVPFTVRSSSMSNEITYCTMLERDGRYKWEPMVENYYFEPAIPVYSWISEAKSEAISEAKSGTKGAGVTPNGLVYDLYRIYTGRYAIQQPVYNYWNTAGVDLFTPLVPCPRMAAIPFATTHIFTEWNYYVLYYLSRYLRLRAMNPDKPLCFWSPSSFGSLSIRLDDWKESRQWTFSGVEWKPDVPIGCWAEEVVGFLPSPSISELGREDIQTLRQHHPTWLSAPSAQRKCVVIGDFITESVIQRLREILPSMRFVSVISGYDGDSDVEREAQWIGASLCILVGGAQTSEKWSPLWLLPKGAVLLEFQPESALDGECQHVAHVADLNSWIFLLSKGSTGDLQDQLVDEVGKWWKAHQADAFVATV